MVINICNTDVLISDCDFEKIMSLKWSKTANGKYFTHTNYKPHKFNIRLHRFILDAPAGVLVDHINGNTFDNRRENLRLCSITENSRNREKRSDSNNPYKGVHYNKQRKKWRSYIQINGKQKWLGYFNTAEEAREAYIEQAKKLHGEFARW